MNRRKVIIINGPSGVGKSTVSHIFSRDIRQGVHIDVDILRHLVANHRLTHEQVHLAYRNAAALANNFLDEGYTVIVDGVFPKGGDLALFCRALREPRADVYVYTLSGELPVLQQREAMKMGSDSFSKRVSKLHKAMQAHADRLGVTIDTTNMGIMETVSRIKEMLARGIGRLTDGFCRERRVRPELRSAGRASRPSS